MIWQELLKIARYSNESIMIIAGVVIAADLAT